MRTYPAVEFRATCHSSDNSSATKCQCLTSLTVRGAHLQIRAQLALTLVRGMDFHLSGNINIVNSAHLRRQTSWKLTGRFLPRKKKCRLQMCHKKKRKISHAKKQPVVLDLEPPNMAVSLCPEKYLGGSGEILK